MKYVPDNTGRFSKRPHFEPIELDSDCEKVVSGFLKNRYGKVEYPLSTNDLTVLLDKACELDVYADLSGEGEGVEGVTHFIPGRKPKVLISSHLQESGRENRLRTTLAHEWGHVRYHDSLWQVDISTGDLFGKKTQPGSIKCKRETMYNAPANYDWMEWQAGYVCGAVLMPHTVVKRLAREFLATRSMEGPITFLQGNITTPLISEVSRKFQVSEDAARVRLLKLKVIVEGATEGLNFGT